MVGGHEGAGVVEEVGPGVTLVKPGDHCVLGFIPSCGRCMVRHRPPNLCDNGADIIRPGRSRTGPTGSTPAARTLGPDVLMLGTFSPYTVVTEPLGGPHRRRHPARQGRAGRLRRDHRLGQRRSTRGRSGPGDTVVVMGIGGVGANAVQGARIAGASAIVAIDPVRLQAGAGRACWARPTPSPPSAEAAAAVADLTRGRMAQPAIITTDVVRPTTSPRPCRWWASSAGWP